MKKLIIIGCGQHAGVVADAVQQGNEYEVVTTICDGEEIIPSDKKDCCFHIAIGNEEARERIYKEHSDCEFVTIIHPRGYVATSAQVGNGSFIGINAVVEANAVIGECCILRTGYIVRHNVTVYPFTTL